MGDYPLYFGASISWQTSTAVHLFLTVTAPVTGMLFPSDRTRIPSGNIYRGVWRRRFSFCDLCVGFEQASLNNYRHLTRTPEKQPKNDPRADAVPVVMLTKTEASLSRRSYMKCCWLLYDTKKELVALQCKSWSKSSSYWSNNYSYCTPPPTPTTTTTAEQQRFGV